MGPLFIFMATQSFDTLLVGFDTCNEQKLSKAKQKIVVDFLDTICCALEEMSGEEVFNCFFEAVQNQREYTKKEYDKTNELMHLLIKLK